MEHLLTQVFSDKARLPVRTAIDSRRFEPGNIYICPGDYNLSLENGLMRVEHSPRESICRPSINALFRSAALAYGQRVVGVVLTGKLEDGTAGLWEIKKRGGIAIVQDPAEARYPQMPQSAIASVSVDYVLPIEDIVRKLIEFAEQPADRSALSALALKVFIVEDERVVAESLKEDLQDGGYRVCGMAASGERAIELIAGRQPDVVLMDIHLAGRLTGIEAARRIWEQFQIPIVYVTAYADTHTLEEVETTENYGYIVKPFHAKAVHAAVQLALNRREKETSRL
jgi:chemotaxis response regulator CheB